MYAKTFRRIRYWVSRFAALGIYPFNGSNGVSTLAEPKTQLRWPGTPLGADIEYAMPALQTVCAEATLGLRKLAKGGLEVGGLLFGDRAEGLIRVLAARPIQCEHRFGPSFVLSDTDEAVLQGMLADFRSDSELASLELLGCYFSHPRHGATLTEREVELCNRYFGQTGRIALILIPRLSGSVQGTLFARDHQGSYVSSHEFEYAGLIPSQGEIIRSELPGHLNPQWSRLKTEAKLSHAMAPGWSHPTPPSANAVDYAPLGQFRFETVATELPTRSPDATLPDRDQAGKLVSIRFRVTRASILSAALIALLCWPNRTNPISQIPLSFTDRGRDLIIHWDTTRAMVRDAVLGMVEIRDGEQAPVQMSIRPDLLRRGWIPYERKSDIVRISFTLAGRGLTVSENAIYVAPERKLAAAQPVESKASATVNSIVSPVREVSEKEASVSTSALSNASLPKPDQSSRPRSFRAPLDRFTPSASPASTRTVMLPDPPAMRLEGGTPGPPLPPLQLALNLSLPAPRPASLSPASGWLIWTGHLPKRSMLSFSAQGASLGYVNGWIPQTPVHLEVHPGELIEGGIVVFTKDESLRSEAPSALNGWNTVVYKQDYARASELEILDSPGPANNWSHLTLRNGTRPQSLIVLDWRTQ